MNPVAAAAMAAAFRYRALLLYARLAKRVRG